MEEKFTKKLLIILCCLVLVVACGFILTSCKQEKLSFESVSVYHTAEKYVSPSGIALKGESMFVSDATLNKLYKLNEEGTVLRSHPFEQPVNAVYVNGDNVYALVGERAGVIYRFDSSLTLLSQADVDHTPIDALVLDGKIYVVNRFSGTVTVLSEDLATTIATIDLSAGKEPVAIATTQGKIFVACHLPSGKATDATVSADLFVINPETNQVTKKIELINGTGSVKDIAVSSDGNYVYMTNLFARYAYPTSQLDRGWINTNGITIVDAVNESVYAGVLLDSVEYGASNPWGIDVIGSGADAKIVCAISGLAEISVVDETAMFAKLAKVQKGEFDYTLEQVVDHVEFSADISQRISIGGNGLREVLLADEDGEQFAYLTQYFDGTVTKVALAKDEYGERQQQLYMIGEQGAPTAERIGEILWYDGNYCYQAWESCASCHPDARADGLNWDNLNDGLGNPKQAKSMMYSHRTPPEMITGARETAELAVRKGMQFIQFNTMEEKLLDCIDDYLKSLAPTQSPYLNRDGTLTESAERGKDLFEEYNCASCHSGPYYTDLQMHTSSSLELDDTWENREFDTPSFVEIWRTAPYTFNGSCATMEEAVRYFVEKSGKTITDEQVKDLSNYILSIGDEGEYYGIQQIFFDRNDDSDELAVQLLVPGRTMEKVVVRKQHDTDKNAYVCIKLYDPNGKQIGESVNAVLTGMVKGDYAVFECDLDIPTDLAKGSYYEVVIVNADNTKESLAKPLRVYYK